MCAAVGAVAQSILSKEPTFVVGGKNALGEILVMSATVHLEVDLFTADSASVFTAVGQTMKNFLSGADFTQQIDSVPMPSNLTLEMKLPDERHSSWSLSFKNSSLVLSVPPDGNLSAFSESIRANGPLMNFTGYVEAAVAPLVRRLVREETRYLVIFIGVGALMTSFCSYLAFRGLCNQRRVEEDVVRRARPENKIINIAELLPDDVGLSCPLTFAPPEEPYRVKSSMGTFRDPSGELVTTSGAFEKAWLERALRARNQCPVTCLVSEGIVSAPDILDRLRAPAPTIEPSSSLKEPLLDDSRSEAGYGSFSTGV